MKKLLIVSLFLCSQLSFAEILLDSTVAGKTLKDVQILKSAKVRLSGEKIDFTTVGFGIRNKKLLISSADVYISQLMVSDPSKFVRSSKDDLALASLSTMRAHLLRIQMNWSVSASEMKTAFMDALHANGVNPDSPSMKAFLSAVEGSRASAKTAITLVADHGKNLLTFEDSNGKVSEIQGDSTFLRDVFSIWLGNPADEGLDVLKKELTENNEI